MRFLLYLSLVLFLGTSSGFVFSQIVPISPLLLGLKIEPLDFDIPRPKSTPLPYNAVLLEMKDTELPIVMLSLYFTNGLQQESLSQAGLLRSSIELLKKGGTKNKNETVFSKSLTRLGASLDVFKNQEFWGIRLNVVRYNFGKAFQLVRELLLEAALPENQLQIIKNTMLVEIKKRNERAESIATRRLQELFYPNHRLGYSIQVEDVERLKKEQIETEILRRTNPENMYVTAAGDINDLQIQEKITALLVSLKKRYQNQFLNKKGIPLHKKSISFSKLRKENSLYKGKILLIEKNIPQVVMRVGAYLPAHRDKDFYPLQVANYILGGGSFTSRLVRKIRVEEGLAYYVYSYNRFQAEGGIFRAGCATRITQSARALSLLLKEILKMNKGVQKEELVLAKESILNSIVFQFDSPQKIIAEEVRFRMHKMPEKYILGFSKKIRNVNQKGIVKISRYWRKDNLYIVVVGPPSLKKELEKIRPVIVKKPNQELFSN